jgi:hypothetical protein
MLFMLLLGMAIIASDSKERKKGGWGLPLEVHGQDQ